ncbi:MAG: isochorismatase family cysteine hydrolase [Candidatus Methanofastidiosia archaeon]|jgi:isochorismate hydrolase
MVKALVIIDMLQGYMKDTDNPEEVIENQIKLIKEFKNHNLPVILSIPDTKQTTQNPVMFRLWGQEFKDDPEGKKLIKELTEVEYDNVVQKSEYSAFYKTDLEKYCKQNNIDEMYFTGVFCGCCVFFSAVDAAYRHIQPYLVRDAAGSPRKSLVSEGFRRETLEKFETTIGPLVTTEELINNLCG